MNSQNHITGPNHTIPMESVREAKSLRSRRYRNRRLGEFLKELNLTEGRATGIPTIQEELKANGSPKATIETDDERTYFLIDIPCHPVFVNEKVILNKDVVKDVVKDVIKDVIKEFGVELSERQTIILEMICLDSSISAKAMSEKISEKDSVDERTIQRDLSKLKKIGILIRKGGRKNGEWEIVTNRS